MVAMMASMCECVTPAAVARAVGAVAPDGAKKLGRAAVDLEG